MAPLCWYGKLPGSGDFVSRRMPYAVQQFWDDWCASGMEMMRAEKAVNGWDFWGNSPMWAFLVPEKVGPAASQFGLIAPSCDRVGRNFPFVATLTLDEAAGAEHASSLLHRSAALGIAWSGLVDQAQQGRHGVDLLDAALEAALASVMATEVAEDDGDATLPHGMSPAILPWPDLARTFEFQGTESYWWSVPPARTGFRALTHAGALNAAQFSNLFA